MQLFVDDYPTRDGTCVRDYVHVNDLADAHILALHYMEVQAGMHAFNLGSGDGFSVKEVLDAVARVTGKPVPHLIAPRRSGDPPSLVASRELAHAQLGWQPLYRRLDDIVESAFRWHKQPHF
jgi:UDP-glucose 4-epimerase